MGHHHQPDLPPVLQKLSSRYPKAPLGLMFKFTDPALSAQSVQLNLTNRLMLSKPKPSRVGRKTFGLARKPPRTIINWPGHSFHFLRDGTALKPGARPVAPSLTRPFGASYLLCVFSATDRSFLGRQPILGLLTNNQP